MCDLKDQKLGEYDKEFNAFSKRETDLNKQISKLKKGRKVDMYIGGALIATVAGLIVFK